MRGHTWKNIPGTYTASLGRTADARGEYVIDADGNDYFGPQFNGLLDLIDADPDGSSELVIHYRASGSYDPGHWGRTAEDAEPAGGDSETEFDFATIDGKRIPDTLGEALYDLHRDTIEKEAETIELPEREPPDRDDY